MNALLKPITARCVPPRPLFNREYLGSHDAWIVANTDLLMQLFIDTTGRVPAEDEIHAYRGWCEQQHRDEVDMYEELKREWSTLHRSRRE